MRGTSNTAPLHKYSPAVKQPLRTPLKPRLAANSNSLRLLHRLRRDCRLLLKFISQPRRPKTVGEENKQQQYTYYKRRNQRENQAQPLKLQVHEVRHDQRCLDDRQAEQHDQHQVNRHRLVSQEDLDERQRHQPAPDRDEQFVTAGEMFFSVCVFSHSGSSTYLARCPPTSTDMM